MKRQGANPQPQPKSGGGMRASNIVKSAVRQALERDFGQRPSGDDLDTSATSSEEKQGNENQEGADFDRGDSTTNLPPPPGPDDAKANSGPSKPGQDKDKDMEIVSQYYKKPIYVNDPKQNPFYEPVYYVGPGGLTQGYTGNYSDLFEYDVVLESGKKRKKRQKQKKVATCITVIFLVLVFFCCVALMVALTWPKEGEIRPRRPVELYNYQTMDSYHDYHHLHNGTVIKRSEKTLSIIKEELHQPDR